MSITMTRTEYDALINASQAAVDAGDSNLDVLSLRNTVDEANGITRYFLLVRWVNAGDNQRPQLGQTWPPTLEHNIELERPISRADVDQVLADQASNPVTVLVTRDRQGVVGLTALDDYNF
jgi:hypothetical protein